MKARVKATGEIVEVKIDYRQDADYISTSGQLYWQRELDFYVENKEPDYWTRLEHQYAGMAMQGFLASGMENTYENVAEYSIKQAHALVEKYKKEDLK